MVRALVKARRVGDSLVVTLTKPLLAVAGIKEGDPLVLETGSDGRITLMIEEDEAAQIQIREEELSVL